VSQAALNPVLARASEPFFKTTASARALDLAMARGVTEQSGGFRIDNV
jgi:hypothetical protein